MVDLDQEDPVLDIDEPGMARDGFAGDPRPFLEERIVGIALQPTPLAHVFAQEVSDLLHEEKSPPLTISTWVSGVR